MNTTLPITTREKQILNLFAEGFTTKEIAEVLFISRHTVEAHKRKMMLKYRAKNLVQLAVNAVRTGTIS